MDQTGGEQQTSFADKKIYESMVQNNHSGSPQRQRGMDDNIMSLQSKIHSTFRHLEMSAKTFQQDVQMFNPADKDDAFKNNYTSHKTANDYNTPLKSF